MLTRSYTRTSAREAPDATAPRGGRAGEIVAGRYRIEHAIGAGGNGAVYRAVHLALELPVAIKLLSLDGLSDAERERLVCRFEREARTTASIHHRNVLSVHDTGRLPDGAPYLVMELIDGEDLEERVARGPLDVPAVVDLGRQLFAGLSAIAHAGVVHRDVKPANVMLHREADGQVLVKLVDFGIARPSASESRLTVTGVIMGTPHYMAPEQLRGEDLDARCDLYAACAVLYEATTGRPPFDGDSAPIVIGQILAGRFPPVRTLRPDCPETLAELLERGLAPERDGRPERAVDCVAALDRIAREAGLATGALAWNESGAPSPAAPAPRVGPRVGAGLETTTESFRPRSAPSAQGPVEDPSPSVAEAPSARLLPRRGRGGMIVGALAILAAFVTVTAVVAERSSPSLEAAPAATEAAVAAPSGEAARGEHELTIDEMLDAGLEALARGEVEAALSHYRAAAARAPERPEAARGRGLAAARAGLDDEAILSFERYLALAPDAGDATRVRARLDALRARRGGDGERGDGAR